MNILNVSNTNAAAEMSSLAFTDVLIKFTRAVVFVEVSCKYDSGAIRFL